MLWSAYCFSKPKKGLWHLLGIRNNSLKRQLMNRFLGTPSWCDQGLHFPKRGQQSCRYEMRENKSQQRVGSGLR